MRCPRARRPIAQLTQRAAWITLIVVGSIPAAANPPQLGCNPIGGQEAVHAFQTSGAERQLKLLWQWAKELYPSQTLTETRQPPPPQPLCQVLMVFNDKRLPNEVRRSTALVLRGVGTGAEAAIADLTRVIQDRSEDPDLRLASLQALRGIGSGGSVAVLFDQLTDPNAAISNFAAETLEALYFDDQLRQRTPDAHLAILRTLLANKSNDQHRADAILLMGRIASRNLQLVDLIIPSMSDPSWLVRKSSANAIA